MIKGGSENICYKFISLLSIWFYLSNRPSTALTSAGGNTDEHPSGTRIKVRYGKGKNQKIYDAKVTLWYFKISYNIIIEILPDYNWSDTAKIKYK